MVDEPGDALQTGSTVAHRYSIIRYSGDRGFGQVYEAEDSAMATRVALMRLRAEFSQPRTRDSFFETRATATVEHPRVVDLSDYGEDLDGRLFLVMPWVPEAQPLDTWRAGRGRLPWPRVQAIIEQIADGLFAAHEKGVLHGGLDFSHVLIDPDGDVHIVDFGLAPALTRPGGRPITNSGPLAGNPTYLAPEQIRGEANDARSDLYALGVMLWELIAGQPPFVGDRLEVASAHLDEALPGLARHDAPAEIEALLMLALAKDKEERLASAAEFAELLRAMPAAAAETTTAAATPAPAVAAAVSVAASAVRSPAQPMPPPRRPVVKPKPPAAKPASPPAAPPAPGPKPPPANPPAAPPALESSPPPASPPAAASAPKPTRSPVAAAPKPSPPPANPPPANPPAAPAAAPRPPAAATTSTPTPAPAPAPAPSTSDVGPTHGIAETDPTPSREAPPAQPSVRVTGAARIVAQAGVMAPALVDAPTYPSPAPTPDDRPLPPASPASEPPAAAPSVVIAQQPSPPAPASPAAQPEPKARRTLGKLQKAIIAFLIFDVLVVLAWLLFGRHPDDAAPSEDDPAAETTPADQTAALGERGDGSDDRSTLEPSGDPATDTAANTPPNTGDPGPAQPKLSVQEAVAAALPPEPQSIGPVRDPEPTLTDKDFREGMVEARAKIIRDCMDSRMRRTLKVALEVAPEGTVTRARILGDLGGTKLGRCVIKRVYQTEFPASDGGGNHVYTLRLR